jgi:hypothetical protein
MKNVPDRFRIATLLVGIVLGWFAVATILAEKLSPKTLQFSQDLTLSDSSASGSAAEWAAAAAPLRGDLLADVAVARAAPALGAGKAPPSPEIIETRERALASAKQSLSLAPHSSRTWLLLAMLQNQGQDRQSVAEALRMSYLTSAADVALIPARLGVISASAAIADADLKNLARGDIRLILTRRPDLKPAIASAYRRGSSDGKAYIGEVVRSLDPGFAASLQ